MVIEKDFIERIDQLIRLKATGKPQEFAEKLDVSERQIYRLISCLKEIGCPIVYDRTICSYKYEVEGELKFAFCPKDDESVNSERLDNAAMQSVVGGSCKSFLLTDWCWQWEQLDLKCESSH